MNVLTNEKVRSFFSVSNYIIVCFSFVLSFVTHQLFVFWNLVSFFSSSSSSQNILAVEAGESLVGKIVVVVKKSIEAKNLNLELNGIEKSSIVNGESSSE